MKTYNDFLKIKDNPERLKAFILDAISEHKATEDYQTAEDAKLYMKTQNPTIMRYKKLLYTMTGEVVPDNYSANHKCASSFFKRFVTQENQHLLGNGVTFSNDATKKKLGKDFDYKIQDAGRIALVQKMAFAFADLDRIKIFEYVEFVPLWDENNGALMAGIRFWQVADDKPLRVTLFETDGFTEFVKPVDTKKNELQIMKEKRAYKLRTRTSEIDGTEIYKGENYPTFPIIPLWGNPEHQSELNTIRSQIDAYDLIKSGFANDLDDASMIYWILKNAGGMDDDEELAKFLDRVRTTRVASIGDGIGEGASAEPHTMEVPYQSREAYLSRLEKDMYKDFMAADVEQIAAGNVTATQIEAAYNPLTAKCDDFERCVGDFIHGILEVFGIDDSPSFTRSMISNKSEEVDNVLKAADYTSEEYTTKKLLTILGDIDLLDEVLAQRADESLSRLSNAPEETDEESEEDEEDADDLDFEE